MSSKTPISRLESVGCQRSSGIRRAAVYRIHRCVAQCPDLEGTRKPTRAPPRGGLFHRARLKLNATIPSTHPPQLSLLFLLPLCHTNGRFGKLNCVNLTSKCYNISSACIRDLGKYFDRALRLETKPICPFLFTASYLSDAQLLNISQDYRLLTPWHLIASRESAWVAYRLHHRITLRTQNAADCRACYPCRPGQLALTVRTRDWRLGIRSSPSMLAH